jgi:chaperonin cofactor prefoldin
MRFILVVVLLTLTLAASAGASSRNVTIYLDGARVENELPAPRAYLEVSLPGNIQANSLHLVPRGKIDISRVEVVPARTERRTEKEIARLTERREALQDRLKALETREEIFLAAAKSQSGKAPRKSKTNPDPMTAIRKGTEYAIAQLEGVYRMRRKAERELSEVDASLAELKKKGNTNGSVARVWLTGKGGRVKVSYLLTGVAWTPRYTFRLNGDGQAEVAMFADIPAVARGAAVAVVPASMAESAGRAPLPVAVEGSGMVTALRLPVEKAQFAQTPQSCLSFSFRTPAEARLPAGEASCFWRGEYLGKVRFDGSLPGEMKELVVGR